MAEAAGVSLDMAALQLAAGQAIARATGAEAGMVTTGAAAALTLAAAACLAGNDPARMAALPHTEVLANEILIPRTHRTQYSRAVAVAGARLVDVGHNDRGTGAGIRGLEAWEIAAARTPRTVGFLFAATPATLPELPRIAAACRALALPVIVDAAAQLPPASNLTRIIADGADLVAFSGGKAIGGPQASGILAGRADLVGSALVQMLDMDVPPETWRPPLGLNMAGPPHHGIGRGFKAGKEEIVGLLVALERFLARDEATEAAAITARLQAMQAALAPLPVQLLDTRATGRLPLLELILPTPEAARALALRLREGSPTVHVSERRAAEARLTIDAQALRAEDDRALVAAIRAAA
jgi:L-seryl-tRNA(Ser) seleniumtransferase